MMARLLAWTRIPFSGTFYCEGRSRHEVCDGGRGYRETRRARWRRSDGRLQCATCKRADEQATRIARTPPDGEAGRA